MPFLEQHDITNPEITPSYADAEKFLDLIAGDPGKCFMFRVVAERADLQAELAPLQKKENEKAKLENRKPKDLSAAAAPGTLAELWDWLVGCNAQGWAVYVVINETIGIVIRTSFVSAPTSPISTKSSRMRSSATSERSACGVLMSWLQPQWPSAPAPTNSIPIGSLKAFP